MNNVLNFFIELLRLFKRPTLFISFAIAWFFTNGHAYALFGIGIAFHIEWMKWYGGTYLAILWMPFTPEKLITIPLAFYIEKILFQISRNNKWLIGELEKEHRTFQKEKRRNKWMINAK